MLSLKNLSINAKLNLLVIVAAGIAIMLACGAFGVNDYRMMRDSKVRQLTALADVLGSNSTAALTFDDPITASELLASLREQPTIELACLYDEANEVFATYRVDGCHHETPPLPGSPGHQFTDHGYLEVTQPIVEDGERIGTISLHASVSDLRSQLHQYVNIVVVVMIVSLMGSVLLSSRLQRMISLPILNLAQTAQKISADGDYSIRVQRTANDELGTLYDEFNVMLDRAERSEQELQEAHDELEHRVQQRTRQLSEANLDLSREIVERKRAEKELEDTHQRLVDTAHRAGMAEIATGVLHNVGNVLNSINVSATLVADRIRNSKVLNLNRTMDMVNEHADDLGTFFTEHEKGKLIPGFLNVLTDHLQQERASTLEELQTLSNNIDHVKTIVAMQQSYAGQGGMVESVAISELLEDALKMNHASFEKHGIEVVCEYQDLPKIRVEKQKLLQILVNLVANAKDALIESSETTNRKLTVAVSLSAENRAQIQVSDNGIGILLENLTRIFSHGFTTKRHGHGFGLHASANTAREIGGELTAQSDGPNCGATFTIDLPFVPVEVAV